MDATSQHAPRPVRFGFLSRRVQLLRFLLVSSGLVRDPVLYSTITGSLSRAGLIYAINQTAQSVGLGWPAALLTACAIVFIVSIYISRVRAHIMINRIQTAMRRRMTRMLLRADIDFLLSRDHGQVYSAMTRETEETSGAVINIIEAIEALIVVCIAVPYLFWISWSAGLATLIAIAVGTTGFILLDLPARGLMVRSTRAMAEFCNRVDDMLGGWKELRLRDTRRQAVEGETLRMIDEVANMRIRAERLYSGSSVVAQSSMILLLCFVVMLVPLLQGGTTETMFQVLTVVLLTSGPIELLFNALPRIARAEASHAKIMEVEEALQAAQTNRPLELLNHPTSFSSIELRGITARVGAGEEAFELGPVDLTFRPGETVFICGGNGSGKTTLLSIISGLRWPDGGEVLLDGAPLTRENVAEFRELFTGVFSGFHLFDRTFGLSAEEQQELERRITELNLSDRVGLHEGRFSSLSLSSGQKRRLALAVALAEQRPIIILDEFAADQDPENRAFFYDVLVPEMAATGQLVIAVTHDDHQFAKCDRLIKMAAGRIVSDEVMRPSGKRQTAQV
ncbi:putative ATP-binding cassette transporter [Salinihabitans flavidus]|uniref:Putative ATP-binding cassette transporter n=1 Tax=Salinihabitans flavidus TaxID=569882 RepID=A0A1H8LD83_9RHOB|nr:ATP-binding cassette domain-containing protein [Salinihabitans flavidus]SEO03140.1 putative ATP-binding cassette transporter [Salinihabitans flavidus]